MTRRNSNGDATVNRYRTGGDGVFISSQLIVSSDVTINTTTALTIPDGTEAERPTGVTGMIRFNTDITQFEGYNGSAWSSIGGGATGGGADTVFFENNNAVTTNYELTANKNAVSAGPITINSGVTVTVPSGQSWVIV